jgi:RNA polymerase sigma-70 factor (ECF subfamily)
VEERTDEYLVNASRRGDREAYAALVRRHSRRVYAVCLGILADVTDSEDIMQETFIKGFSRIHTLRSGEAFGAWIGSIARNICRDHVRTNARRRELLQEQQNIEEPGREVFSELHMALAELPEEYRLPLMLYYFDGKSAKRLAQELDISHAGACTRLSRARKELRKILDRQAGSK